ncbi:CheB methylesterase domain-containing protein [Sulfurospirillum deleyianum]|uniref:protein-glutamate methylesterase n=1 Tax=Sulfurospirillum deleyianum (strain ATCC 51133 / DSM 6946 / 5175) TaxID=525898 RepID=D1B197_SULD5|nr:CheB methylesterase domain-containing protein [Sulfurospirillum deleyianum]ACZ11867.1 Protein-glutamate methylesterase [Sulfurospirillum deleyianum DSM 6946]
MKPKIVLIGASTGGPGHLKKILAAIPESFHATIIIAQHMNSMFIPSFITQFQNELPFLVHGVDKKMSLQPSSIYICPQNCHLLRGEVSPKIEPIIEGDTPYNPSIDTLFLSSLSCLHDADILAVLLTGIGHDGANGLSELQKHGAKCIAESEESAIVYGMPKRAVEINPNITSMPLHQIIDAIKLFGAS